jgi:hypothetical protein
VTAEDGGKNKQGVRRRAEGGGKKNYYEKYSGNSSLAENFHWHEIFLLRAVSVSQSLPQMLTIARLAVTIPSMLIVPR